MQIPRPIKTFRDVLLAVEPTPIVIPGTSPSIIGRPGIRESTRIQYNKHDFQELARSHEYSFALRNGKLLELSLQLYMNTNDHWRLFAYSVVDGNQAPGMLFSVNLTFGQDGSNMLALRQRLMLANRSLKAEDRREAAEALATRLRGCGLHVTEDRDIVFRSFDVGKKAFVGTSAAAFIRDFVIAAVIKGPYMANKGYELPGVDDDLKPIPRPNRAKISLEAAEETVDEEGAFAPEDKEDARDRTLTAIVRRRGQPEFRRALIKAYEGKCALTGCDFEGALEAAHITPYMGVHTNHITNGLLLRADIHTLFDLRHIAVDTTTMKVRLADVLKGTKYWTLNGKPLSLPKNEKWHPSVLALDNQRREAGL